MQVPPQDTEKGSSQLSYELAAQEIDPSTDMTTYYVNVYTAEGRGSGTDANVSISLKGSAGVSNQVRVGEPEGAHPVTALSQLCRMPLCRQHSIPPSFNPFCPSSNNPFPLQPFSFPDFTAQHPRLVFSGAQGRLRVQTPQPAHARDVHALPRQLRPRSGLDRPEGMKRLLKLGWTRRNSAMTRCSGAGGGGVRAQPV